ncbi:MAG: transglycosylase SLT domain-containing protein [Methylobacter tundripaludum]|nr:transglycosylase SLT domain-containing protein [Methylobacter tundripaludum]
MKHLSGKLLLCLVLFSGAVLGNSLDRQRSDFLQAERALAQGNNAEFMRISAALIDYPLYPYLQYQWLKDNLQQEDRIPAFLATYNDTRYAGLLRIKWLDYLAKNERWNDFIRHYSVPAANENTALSCQYNLAIYKTGNQQQALNEAKNIWLTGDSLPEECDPLLSVLMTSPGFTPDLVWQRFELALDKDNVSVAEYVRRSLDAADQDVADGWLRVHQNPALIENSGFFNAQMGRLFAHGVTRLAKSDLNRAVELWDDRKNSFQIDAQTAGKVERSLAIALARSRNINAYQRLKQLPVVDAEVNEWKVRAALLEQNWQHVAEALSGLTVQERQDPKWQYWQARMLDKTGNSLQAQDVYNKLAEDRSFYGFLAADTVNKPYQLSNKPVFLAGNELENLADEADFKVVKELDLLNRNVEAERQWWYAVKKLSKERRMIAAKLAQQWHWDQIAITTMVKADYWDDLALRFPVYYSGQIHDHAYRQNLDPAIVFGLIRQESIFNKDAESSVGARGLMQIMPKTGMQIARELKEKWQSDQSLFNPDVNVKYGAFYYKKLLKQFHGHFVLAVAAYNAGPGRVAKWLPGAVAMPADIWVETIPYHETRKYVSSVLSYAIIYQQLILGNCSMHYSTSCVPAVERKGLKIKELMLDVLSG